jgi:hypothetical protein
MLAWAREQLELAGQIVDNPGGGLLFATQTVGQVRSALNEADADRWRPVVEALDRSEDAMVRRDLQLAGELLAEAASKL